MKLVFSLAAAISFGAAIQLRKGERPDQIGFAQVSMYIEGVGADPELATNALKQAEADAQQTLETSAMAAQDGFFNESGTAIAAVTESGVNSNVSIGLTSNAAAAQIYQSAYEGENALLMSAMNAVNQMNAATLADVNKKNKEALKKQNDAAKKG